NIKVIAENINIDRIILIDNSIKKNHSIYFTEKNKVEYYKLKYNEGIGKAQNIGIDKLLKEDIVKGIFFFDQDSILEETFISKMLETYLFVKERYNNIGIIAPTIIEKSSSEKFEIENYTICKEIISSGSLLNVEMIKAIGGMEEQLFIDYVDFEYCWRAIKKNYKIIRANTVTLEHKVGEKVLKIFKYNIYVPAPFRYYYIYRNGSILAKRNYIPNYWKIRERILRIITPIVILLFLDKKRQRLKYVLKGMNYEREEKAK
ncbi:MAG: glycosyltransferase, partial [Carnobacterium sp.]|nr:glycosyltransferase [Carnobacterium sp.]